MGRRPSARAVCVRGFLGTPSRVGWGKAAYNTLLPACQ